MRHSEVEGSYNLSNRLRTVFFNNLNGSLGFHGAGARNKLNYIHTKKMKNHDLGVLHMTSDYSVMNIFFIN